MKRAIVLSGGGGKGGYQIGFWKAIRKLGIKYDIVTGTSIGALNGALMVQGNYYDALRLWLNMDYSKAFKGGMNNNKFSSIEGKKYIIKKYAKSALLGGIQPDELEKVIKNNLKLDLFYSNDIDYGLVTVKFPSMEPILLTKKDIKKELLADYLLASASCFPAFKMKEINNENYIDGGYHDNMPIELALKMGAEEVIAVDLKAPGKIKKQINTTVPIKLIAPKNNIGNFLVLEKSWARRSIKLGYNDTMKAFNKLDGNIYTFKKGSPKRNLDRLEERFYNNLDLYIKNKDNIKVKNLYGKNKEKYFLNILENLMSAFSLDETEIYRTSYANALIKKYFKKEEELSFNKVKKMINLKKFTKNTISREIICYIYNELLVKGKSSKLIEKLADILPDSFLCAIYLKTILKK